MGFRGRYLTCNSAATLDRSSRSFLCQRRYSVETYLLLRTAAKYVALLASALTTKEAAGVLEVSESRVRQRLGEGTLYGVNAGRENRLPAFQFEGGKEVPGIAEVLARVDRSLHPVAVLNWCGQGLGENQLGAEAQMPTLVADDP